MVEKHISKCGDVRRIGDWKSVLREVDAAVAAGADSSPQVWIIVFMVSDCDCGFSFVAILAVKCG